MDLYWLIPLPTGECVDSMIIKSSMINFWNFQTQFQLHQGDQTAHFGCPISAAADAATTGNFKDNRRI